MPRKLSFVASRHRGVRLFRWSAAALAGVIAGMLLGEMAVGTRSIGRMGEPATYSHLSANPDAAAAPVGGATPCPDCRDSYGVAARLRADREDRMSHEFRELGAVDLDPPPPDESDDGYRYGGRFPDPPPREVRRVVTAPAIVPASVADDEPVAAETSALPPQY